MLILSAVGINYRNHRFCWLTNLRLWLLVLNFDRTVVTLAQCIRTVQCRAVSGTHGSSQVSSEILEVSQSSSLSATGRWCFYVADRDSIRRFYVGRRYPGKRCCNLVLLQTSVGPHETFTLGWWQRQEHSATATTQLFAHPVSATAQHRTAHTL